MQSTSDKNAAFASLERLALDLRWSWNHATDKLWRQLEPSLWARTHNPWMVLQTVSRERLGQMLEDPAFRDKIEKLMETEHQTLEGPSWFRNTYPHAPITQVAYFSMEFMLSEALPIYAGGLGNVAGDQLKSASDLGVPVIGVGLLYQLGYFRQSIDRNGAQQALFPYNDPGQLPVAPLRQADGEWLRVELEFPGGTLWLRAWQVRVGRLHLYLLDSNDLANYPAYRSITGELYGGGSEQRLQQELALGIGGWRLLQMLGIAPEVCHLNEGHAAFAVLERAKSFMRASGQPFDTALAITRAGNVFTTHTAVPAGFDRFEPHLIQQYLQTYATNDLGIELERLLALGRANPNDPTESFNMAYLAVRASGAVNGVSRLHGEVSRQIFQPLFPRWPASHIPIGSITNGVHMPSWDSPEADALWTQACGKDRWSNTLESLSTDIRGVSDQALWDMRTTTRRSLVEYVRERLSWQLAASGAAADTVDGALQVFNPETLTLGFARRFATYKRPNLLLHDPERLLRLLTHRERPVQLILAGKAHPNDGFGQELIRQWVQFVRRPEVRPHAVFLSDYDMLLTERLVQGVDVWLNTPRRPWEASGTSGMKVLVNGGLNFSELDGWWAEAYSPELGWALGDGREHDSDPAWDAAEANRLYELLENEIVPAFYARDSSGIPRAWVARVRKSMAHLTPQYSANRSVREYVEQCYLPAATRYRQRIDHDSARGIAIANQLRTLDYGWHTLRFGRVSIESSEGKHHFTVEAHSGALDPESLRVELYADSPSGQAPFCQAMTRAASGSADTVVYQTVVPATRAATDYTARIVPAIEDVALPLECTHIVWQR